MRGCPATSCIAEHAGNGGHHQARIRERREINEDRSVGKRFVQPDSNLDRQSGLAHAAWSGQRE